MMLFKYSFRCPDCDPVGGGGNSDGTTSGGNDKSLSVLLFDLEIVGISAACLVVLILIIAVIVWKMGKCCCVCHCQKPPSEIVENNELYGAPADDYQYAKDQYNTKTVDNNDYYYDN